MSAFDNVKDHIREIVPQVEPTDILVAAMKIPGVKIDRAKFLRKELTPYESSKTIDMTINTNPAQANIKRETINNIATQVISYETNKVTAMSFGAGLPGGPAAIAGIGIDVTQYFAFMLRVMQKLMYLYGFEDLDLHEDAIDDYTMNQMLVFLGVMYGVQNANAAIKMVVDVAAKKLEKDIARKALTKGAIYPIIKQISKIIGLQMNKQIFAKCASELVPVIGGITSSGISYVTFKPCAIKLKKSFQQLPIADPNFYNSRNQ